MANTSLNSAMGLTGPAPGTTGADPHAYDYLNGTNLGPGGGVSAVGLAPAPAPVTANGNKYGTGGALVQDMGAPIPGYTYDAATGQYNHTPKNAAAPAPAPGASGVAPAPSTKFTPDQMKAAADWYKNGLLPLAAKDMGAAKTLYNKAKTDFGFTDEDFSHVDGVGFTPAQIAAWSGTSAAPAPAPAAASGGGTTGTTPTSGILANAMDAKTATSTYTPALAGTPKTWDVTKDQTVSGQMEKYADPNDPYNQLWRTQGLQTAAERGLLNSSMAESAALDSVMRNATPIATADAGTYSKAAGYNADEQNQFTLTDTAAKNTAGQFNAGQTNTMTQAGMQRDTTLQTNAANNATQIATANISAAASNYNAQLSADTQKTIAQLNNENQAAISKAHDENSDILQNSTAAANAYRDYANALLNIQLSTTMDEAAKKTAIQNLTDVYNKAMAAFKAAGSGIPDASVLLNFEDKVDDITKPVSKTTTEAPPL